MNVKSVEFPGPTIFFEILLNEEFSSFIVEECPLLACRPRRATPFEAGSNLS